MRRVSGRSGSGLGQRGSGTGFDGWAVVMMGCKGGQGRSSGQVVACGCILWGLSLVALAVWLAEFF